MSSKQKASAGFKAIGPAHLKAALHATQKRKPAAAAKTAATK